MNNSSKKFYVINCTALDHVPIESKYQVELCIYIRLTILFALATTTVNFIIIFATIKHEKNYKLIFC